MDKLFNTLLTVAESGLADVAKSGNELRCAVQCLLIDQDAHERQRIVDLLGSLGLACDALAAPPAVDQLSLADEPKVVFLEVSKPLQAQSVLQQFALRPRNRSKVFCYADAPGAEDMAALILAGATDVLVKPFDRELLRFKLKQAGVLAH